MKKDKDIITINELARYFKVDRRTITRQLKKLPFFKIGNRYRFKKIDVEKWIENQKRGVKKYGK